MFVKTTLADGITACETSRTVPRTVLLLACGVLKFNMYIVGFNPGQGWTYFPSVQEILVTLAIVAIEFLAYLLFVKRLPVLPAPEHA